MKFVYSLRPTSSPRSKIYLFYFQVFQKTDRRSLISDSGSPIPDPRSPVNLEDYNHNGSLSFSSFLLSGAPLFRTLATFFLKSVVCRVLSVNPPLFILA